MDNNLKYIIFAFAGWLLFQATGFVNMKLPNVFVGTTHDFLQGLIFIVQVIGIVTIFVFTIPVLVTAWKEISRN